MLLKLLVIFVIINAISTIYVPGAATALLNLNRARMNYAANARRAATQFRKMSNTRNVNPRIRQIQTRSVEDFDDFPVNGNVDEFEENNMVFNGPEEFSRQNQEHLSPMVQSRNLDGDFPHQIILPILSNEDLGEPENIVQMPRGQDDSEGDAQGVLNNFWAVNNWNVPSPGAMVRKINHHQVNVEPEEVREADPHHHYHSHVKVKQGPNKLIVHEHVKGGITPYHQSGFGNQFGRHGYGTHQSFYNGGHQGYNHQLNPSGSNIQIAQVNGNGLVHQQQNLNQHLFVKEANPNHEIVGSAQQQELEPVMGNPALTIPGLTIPGLQPSFIPPPILPHPILPHPILPNPILPNPILPNPAFHLLPKPALPTDASAYEHQRESFTKLLDHDRQDAQKLIQKITEDNQKLVEQNQRWMASTRARGLDLNKPQNTEDNRPIPIFQNNHHQNIDFNKFIEHSHQRRQADKHVPSVVDGKIPVEVVAVPLEMKVEPLVEQEQKQNNVGAPYLFQFPSNQYSRRSEDRIQRSNLDLLNMAQGITQGTLGSIFAGQNIGNGNKQSESVKMANNIAGQTLKAVKAADTDDPKTLGNSGDEAVLGLINQNYMDQSMNGVFRRSTNSTNVEGEQIDTPNSKTEQTNNNIQESTTTETSSIVTALPIATIELQTNNTGNTESITKNTEPLEIEIPLQVSSNFKNISQEEDLTTTETSSTIAVENSELQLNNTELNNQETTEQPVEDSQSTDERKEHAKELLGKVLDTNKDLTASNMTEKDIETTLQKQREIIKDMRTNNNDDNDMMMLAEIADNILEDIDEARNKSKREIRSFSKKNRIETSNKIISRQKRGNLPLTRLISDPEARLDIPKTFDHVGAVAKHLMDDESAPLYHVRNMMGSTQDALMSALRVPPKKMLVPTKYTVVKDEDLQMKTPMVGAGKRNMESKPEISSRFGDADDNPDAEPSSSSNFDSNDFGISSTFERVGAAIKDSIQSGRETLEHINQVANNAKNVVNTMQNGMPRFVLPLSQVHEGEKAMMIAPRIFDIDDVPSDTLRQSSSSDLLKFGDVMDSVGISNPNAEPVEMEKIIFSKNGPVIIRDEVPKQLKVKSPTLGTIIKKQNQDLAKMEKTLNNLEEVRQIVGAPNLREFILEMKNHAEAAKKHENKIRKKKKKNRKNKKSKNKQTHSETTKNSITDKPKSQITEKSTEKLALNLPPELMHPFMGQASESDMNKFLNLDDNKLKPEHEAVLRATNGVMFEKLSKELARSPRKATFQSEYGDPNPWEALMKIQGQALKPFRGLPRPEMMDEYFEDYIQNQHSPMNYDNSYEHGAVIEDHIPSVEYVENGGPQVEYFK